MGEPDGSALTTEYGTGILKKQGGDSMIYITGDTHNTADMHHLSTKWMKRYCGLQDVNYSDINEVIILGDFGLPWHDCPVDENGIHPVAKDDKYLVRWYNEKPFKVLAVMGNHDNYNMLEKLPKIKMFGDTVLKVSENILYLIRGHIYNIEGKIFLALGGAQSHDKYFRKLNKDLWAQEEWTKEEQDACLERIKKFGTDVDFIVSHTGSINGISCIESSCDDPECVAAFREDSNVCFNDMIDEMMTYQRWFFGHWHKNWGYDHKNESRYVPLFVEGVVVEKLKEL